MNKFLILLLFIPVLAMAQTGDKNFIDQNYIEVTGKSEMEITPDLIYLRIVINEKDDKNKIALAEKEKAMINALKKIGIDVSKDLMIKDMSSRFMNYLLSKDDISLMKEYQLLLHDGKTTGEVYMALEKIDISNITIEKLDHSQMEKFRREVKIEAIKAAKSKAMDLAEAIDQQIGRAIYVQELDNYMNTFRPTNTLRMKSMEFEAPDMDFEKLKLNYSILCRFELK